MGAQQTTMSDPLLAGFYTMRDAARLLRTDSQSKLRGWLNGWSHSNAGPIVLRDFKGYSTVSFLDLMELRFVEHFRGLDVPMPTLRKAAAQARDTWKTTHPFALSRDKYVTDRRNIFAKVAEEEGDNKTYDLATNQYQMWEAIEETIDKGVEFDPATHLAKSWHPMPDYPNVFINPKFGYGAPCITKLGIPTNTLFSQYRAEAARGGYERVADWFGIKAQEVKEAVQFEIALAA